MADRIVSVDDEMALPRPVVAKLADSFPALDAAGRTPLRSSPVMAPPAPLAGVHTVDVAAGVLPVEVHDGRLYGTQGSTLSVSDDDGQTWTPVGTMPHGSPSRIAWTADGELLFVGPSGVWRSTGWDNPATATWAKVLSISTTGAPGIQPWGFDGDGTKYIAAEYSGANRAESRYVWISLDHGQTWAVVVDKTAIDPTNASHMHGVCYDPWEDRFWLSHGHGAIMGTYWSDDDGATWTKLGGAFQPDAAPTTLCATDDGIVCGSDSGQAGMYGIARVTDPAAMEMRWLARWPAPRDGVAGFATRATRDPETGLVVTGFKSDFADTRAAIFAGTARAQATIWTDPVARATAYLRPMVTPAGRLVAHELAADVHRMLVGEMQGAGSTGADKVPLGETGQSTGLALGIDSAATNRGALAVGTASKSLGLGSVALGESSKAGASVANPSTTAVGRSASALPSYSTAVGGESLAGGSQATSVGRAASSVGNSTAVGESALASGVESTALGKSASATTTYAVALGRGAVASHIDSVALGTLQQTTAAQQVKVGARHFEIAPATGVAAPAAGSARLFLQTNAGTGKMELVIRFPTGATQVIMTEP